MGVSKPIDGGLRAAVALAVCLIFSAGDADVQRAPLLRRPAPRCPVLGLASLLAIALTLLICVHRTFAATPPVTPPSDEAGSIHVPAMDVPFPSNASPELRQAFINSLDYYRKQAVAHPMDIQAIRAATSAYFAPLISHQETLYPVAIKADRIGGVPVDIITPRGGVSRRNRNRILINLHGGGFFTGAGAGGQVESIPIAGLGKIKVVSVDYRQGPEYRFPAASEDVAAVFAALLKRYPARNIGIYGGSAGGLLTAETVVWLQAHHQPRPGAVAITSASAGGWAGGDSTYFAPFSVVTPAQAASPSFAVSDAAYFKEADMHDPLVAPINAPDRLAKFPPTLLITGTRDLSMSSAIHTHSELVRLGVEAELHVWEGAGHAFQSDPAIPESKEAYAVIVSFFDRRLGR